MKRIILFSFTFLLTLQLFSQEQKPQADTLRKDALNVFMESTDFIRKEIPYVNYVRDIKDAGVYIISTEQNTGSGGKEYTYFFVGQNAYKGISDTLSFVALPDETSEVTRQKTVSILKIGLMKYVARTPLSQYLKISFTEPMKETVSTDKWNSWVFRSSIYGYMQGRKTYNSYYLSGDLSANKITEDWKINLTSGLNQSEENYIFTDSANNETIINGLNSSKSFGTLIVKSINDHWSAGGSLELGSSSYRNEDFRFSLMPGIEFDLFPYSESTRRQLRILYSAGYTYANYTDTTIYDKLQQHLLSHSLTAAYIIVQKWGNINLSAGWSNYFHDWSKNNLFVSGALDLRIVKGLSVTFYGSAGLVHDQLGLVKKNLSVDQVLLQKKELATQFEYFTSFGFTYTFGSIYNNVVNPRFGNRGGGGISISIN
jgi:hypothetical protein